MTSSFVREPAAAGDAHARDLLGMRAVVTGGTRGIGAAISATLARRGAQVLVSPRNPAPDLPEGVRLVVADAATAEGAERLAQPRRRRCSMRSTFWSTTQAASCRYTAG